MLDDARLAAALATGLVENDSFKISAGFHITQSDTVIRNCFFDHPDDMPCISIGSNVNNSAVEGCTFISRPFDDMEELYDLLEEAHGKTIQA